MTEQTKHFIKILLMPALMLLLILAFVVPASAADFTWDSNTVPIGFASGDVITVTSDASGTLTIPDGVNALTIRGIAGTPTIVTNAQIVVETRGTDAILTLTDLSIKATSNNDALLYETDSTVMLTLNCDNVTLTGGDRDAPSSIYAGITAPELTINGELTAIGGVNGMGPGGNGICISQGGSLTINGDVTSIGGAGSSNDGYGVLAGGNITVTSGSSLYAEGDYGVLNSGRTIYLGGTLTAIANEETALDNGSVEFTDPDAMLTVKNGAGSGTFSIATSGAAAGLEFYKTGGVTLNSQTSATSTSTIGTIFLDPPGAVVWDSVSGSNAASGGTAIDLATTHSTVTTVIVMPTAKGTLMIPNDCDDITVQGWETGVQTQVTDGQIIVATRTTDVELTLKDLAIKAPDDNSTLIYNTNTNMLTLTCDNVLITGGDDIMQNNNGIYSAGPLTITGELDVVGGRDIVLRGGNGIVAADNLTIDGIVRATGGIGNMSINGDGVQFSTGSRTLTVNQGAQLVATGYQGINMSTGSTVSLSGELIATGNYATAMRNGNVTFTDENAVLTVQDAVQNDTNRGSRIIISLDPSMGNIGTDYIFTATSGVTLNSAQDIATSNTTAGHVTVTAIYTPPASSNNKGGSGTGSATIVNLQEGNRTNVSDSNQSEQQNQSQQNESGQQNQNNQNGTNSNNSSGISRTAMIIIGSVIVILIAGAIIWFYKK